MKRTIASVAAALSLWLSLAAGALAQSSCPYIAYGAVLTAAQWNACFAAKQDGLGYVPVNKAGDVMLGKLVMFQSSVSGAGINLPQGAAPTSPNNGDVWTTISGLFVRINGVTIGPLASASSATFAATAPITVSFPAGVVTYAFNYAYAGTFTAAQNINLNAAAIGTTISGAGLHVAAADGVVGRVQVDAYGAIAAFTGASYGGTGASPTAVTSGTQLTGVNAYAYNGAALAGPIASFRTYAAENISSGHQGSKACIATTPTSSTTISDGLCQQNDAGVTIGSPTSGSQGAGTLNATGLYVNGTAVSAAGITALTGDVVAAGPGSAAATIQTAVVTYAKIQNIGALAVMGRAANSSGVGADIQATGASDAVLRESGGTIGFGTIATGGIANNAVTLAKLATQATNTVLGNATSGTAVPTALAVGSCSSASSALIWTTNSGFGCNTSITAAAVPASGLTGTTMASSVVTSSLTTVGALGAGSVTTGFTINAALVTWSGQVPGVNVATAANASGSPSATFGVVKCDGTTITCASGVITSVGGVATSVQIGVTTITSGTDTRILRNSAGVLGEYTISGTGTVVAMTASPTFTGTVTTSALTANSTVTVDAASLILKDAFNRTAWTTAGLRYTSVAANYTDTTSSGTVATAYTDLFAASTIQASSSTTFTNYFNSYFQDPVAGTNVTLTNKWAVGADSLKVGTSNQITITTAGLVTIPGTINVSGTFQAGGNAMTFPGSAATLAALNVADQTLAGGANVTSLSQSTGNITVDCGARPLQYITNGGAYTITAPANDGSCVLLVTNNGSAGSTTFSGFTVGSNTGSSLTTTNTSKFKIYIDRINGTSSYFINALQ